MQELDTPIADALSVASAIVYVIAAVCLISGGYAWAKFGFDIDEVLIILLGIACIIVGTYVSMRSGVGLKS